MKSEQETVWVISSGEYSDYRVHAVVRGGEAEANRLAERANRTVGRYNDKYVTEELPVVDPDVEQVEILFLCSEISNDGSAKDRAPVTRVEWPFKDAGHMPRLQWRWVRAPMYHGGGGLEVWGADHERVRKVFGDRRAMLMADDALRAEHEAHGSR